MYAVNSFYVKKLAYVQRKIRPPSLNLPFPICGKIMIVVYAYFVSRSIAWICIILLKLAVDAYLSIL